MWINSFDIPSKNFTCGHCGENICSGMGYSYRKETKEEDDKHGHIYICHNCKKPTYIDEETQIPGSPYGEMFNKEIFNDELIFLLYEEARRCMKVNAFTSVGLCCRKLLMHIAVDCEAEKGKSFEYYVDYLDKNNYIPKNCKDWVDIIRNKGNEANHEIVILNEGDAKQLIGFIGVIISVIYKMPFQAKNYLDKNLP